MVANVFRIQLTMFILLPLCWRALFHTVGKTSIHALAQTFKQKNRHLLRVYKVVVQMERRLQCNQKVNSAFFECDVSDTEIAR